MQPAETSTTSTPPKVSSPWGQQLLPWLVGIAFFMEALDTTILNTAVPTVSAALKVSPLAMKAVLASYTLSLAVFIPISGWMADRFGTRRVFASAIGVFSLGSLLCGTASDIHLLVLCRVFQGCGGAMMIPVGRLTLVRTFAKSDLIRAMSFVSISALVAPMVGPLVGGLIVHYLHWRFIFFINLPVGLAGLILVYMHLPNYRDPNSKPLDVVGFILFGAGIALLSYVLEIFGDHQLSDREMAGLLAISFALIAGYGFHALHMPYPMLRLHIFRIRTFAVSVSGSFFTRLGIGGVTFILPLLYQVGLGYSAIQSGLLIMPQAAGAMTSKTFNARLLNYAGYRGVLTVNTVVIGILLILFGTIGQQTPLWLILIQAYLYGMFSSLQYTSMNTLAYADIVEKDTSNASSIASTLQQMSMSFGVALAGLTTATFLPEKSIATPGPMLHGIEHAFTVLGIYTILSSAMFWRLKSKDGSNVSRKKEIHVAVQGTA